jgi:serine/threonine protein kinase
MSEPTALSPPPPPAVVDPWAVEGFEIGQRVGRGRFGHVHKVRRRVSQGQDEGQLFAMKVLFKAELEESGVLHQLLNEVEIQAQMRHKYILKLLGVSQDSRRVYLFSHLASNGSIYSCLKRLGKFPSKITGKYIKQLLNALTYLHSKRLVHRDIKPENLLLSSTGELLLCDFGWSSSIDEEGRKTICGTPDYLPPEMIQRTNYSQVVDSWTCGVLCYEFLVGRPPFLAPTQHEIYSRIMICSYTVPPHVCEGARHFMSCALRVDPEKRYTAGELYLHLWVQEQDENGETVLQREHDLLQSASSSSSSAAAAVAAQEEDLSGRLSWDKRVAAHHQNNKTDENQWAGQDNAVKSEAYADL